MRSIPSAATCAAPTTIPWGFTGDGRVDNDPFYYGNFTTPAIAPRASRASFGARSAKKSGHISADDMKVLQADAYSQVADDLLPPLFAAVRAIAAIRRSIICQRDAAISSRWLRGWKKWDRRMLRDSTEAAIFCLRALRHRARGRR